MQAAPYGPAGQRQQLTNDIVGYDITPQMARLSRVNMYLHQFASPVIHEYDTITNTARWDEKFDVILANPPFMSPHGGNQTHDKFRIAATRTEVLFADYILEHLLPDGRAGFIVPEGIIFQNNGDYVALRKWLIEEGGLWAVASLPAGVFQPYSGVKTSILFIDRALARRRDNVLLLKIENDGFGLNTNRNPIAANDLPAALQLVEAARRADYRAALTKLASPVRHRLVSRADFARLDAYRANAAAWNFCHKLYIRLSKAEADVGSFRAGPSPEPRAVARAERAFARLRDEFPANTGLHSVPSSAVELQGEFECRIKPEAIGYGDDPRKPTTLASDLRKCVDNEREYSLSIEASTPAVGSSNDVREVAIGDLCERLQYGLSAPMNTDSDGYRCFRMNEIIRGRMHDGGAMKCVPLSEAEYRKYRLQVGDVLFNRTNSYEHVGRTGLFTLPGDYVFASYLVRLTIKREAALPEYVNTVMNSAIFQTRVKKLASRAIGQANISASNLAKFPIPVPPLEEQRAIVTEVESYRRVVDGCAALLASYKAAFMQADGWPRIKLADLCAGYKAAKPERAPEVFLDYIDIGSIDNKRFALTGTKRLKWSEAPSRARKIVAAGDTLFSLTRPYLKNIALVPDANDGHICSTGFAVLRPKARIILPEFLYFSCLDEAFVTAANDKASGATYPAITETELLSIAIAVPNLETQRNIVTELMREQATLTGVGELKSKNEAYIHARLAAVWGEAPGVEIASLSEINSPDADADGSAAA